MRRIPAKTGAMVMPVVVTPEGEWLQDTTHIVDVLEQRFPDAPVLPATPRQRIVAELLEMWADEWWIPAAMHYRWSLDRKSVAWGKSVSVRVDIGGRRIIKKTISKGSAPQQHHTYECVMISMSDNGTGKT